MKSMLKLSEWVGEVGASTNGGAEAGGHELFTAVHRK